jgi:hypothetical protein
VLAMASSPTFDAGQLDQTWEALVNDPAAPLLNRATLGRYAAGELETGLFPGGLSGMGVVPTPLFELPTGDLPGEASVQSGASGGYSPLQMALAAATISGGGVRPAPQLVSAVNNPQSGWMPLTALGQVERALTPEQAASIAQQQAVEGQEFWQATTIVAPQSGKPVTWYVGGTQPGLNGTPYAVALVIEDNASELATQIGQAMLQALQWGKATESP